MQRESMSAIGTMPCPCTGVGPDDAFGMHAAPRILRCYMSARASPAGQSVRHQRSSVSKDAVPGAHGRPRRFIETHASHRRLSFDAFPSAMPVKRAWRTELSASLAMGHSEILDNRTVSTPTSFSLISKIFPKIQTDLFVRRRPPSTPTSRKEVFDEKIRRLAPEFRAFVDKNVRP